MTETGQEAFDDYRTVPIDDIQWVMHKKHKTISGCYYNDHYYSISDITQDEYLHEQYHKQLKRKWVIGR